MPGGRGLFSPAAGGPRTVARTPHDYISPATRRQKGIVPSPAPALFDTATSTFMGESTMNDDEAERKERRRSRVLELQRRNLSSPAAPADRRLSEPLSGLTNTQLTEHYTNCIKLSAENKINAKNAFGLHLIDYMSELLKKKEMNNFQVASSTLDASAKIYAGRVDAVHSETYKVLSGLGRGVERLEERGAETGDADTADAACEQGEAREKKRKRARKSNTIETNIKNLNVNKFDLEFEVDPLFSKTSAAFDEGGTGGLLLNHLRCMDDASELILDSNTVVTSMNELQADDPQNIGAHRMVDLTEFRAMYTGLKLQALQICPAFADFEFMNWNRDGEDVFGMLNASQSNCSLPSVNEHAFDLDAEIEPIPETTAVGDLPGACGDAGADGFDDFAADDDDAGSIAASERTVRDFCMGDGPAANIFNKAMDDIKHGTVGTLMQVLAQEPSDYSYFKSNLLRTWAGPGHWKPAPKLKGALEPDGTQDGGKKSKDKKNDIFHLNYREATDFDSLFKESRASTTLTKATLDKYGKSQTTLPEDLHYDADNLFKLFEKPKLMIKRYDEKGRDDDGEVSNYDYDNENDRENFCPASQEDDEDNDAGFELTNISDNVFGQTLSQDMTTQANTTALDGTMLVGDRLVQEPRKIARVDIGYAKAPKKVDVKKVKHCMWSILTKPETKQETTDNEPMDSTATSDVTHPSTSDDTSVENQRSTSVAGSHSFKTMLTELPKKMSKSLAKNLSVPIAFVCLLHLANEKTLDLTSDETMADLQIKQG